MSRGVALLLDHNNAHRAELIELLHTWQWPVLATADARLAVHYLDDQRVLICVINATLFWGKRRDLTMVVNALAPHQKMILASGKPWLLTQMKADRLANIIWLPYPIPETALQATLVPLRASDEQGVAQDHVGEMSCFEIDRVQRRLRLPNRDVRLSKDELTLLQYLYDANGRICQYDELARLLYPTNYDEREARHLLRGRMYYLQTKIERDLKNPEYLVCERGLGYQLRVPGRQNPYDRWMNS
ncbi:MAG: winged helix-turn-helix domain-containing protein [Chloroflexus sp.]|nr:winged helix-turn-helix domain-containing protein [Chloroflexus sp.]